MDSNEWLRGIQRVIEWILLLLVLRWILRSRMQSPTTNGNPRLVYPRSVKIIGVSGFIAFGAAAVLSSMAPNTSPAVPLLFLGFALVSAWIAAESLRVWHEILETGIAYNRLIRGPGYLRWFEIRKVHYSSWMGAFVLKGSTGETVHISILMTGLPEFARMVLTRVPSEAIDPKTRAILQETALGNPPGLWM